MKKIKRTAAFFAVLSLAAVGCQKENIGNSAQETSISEASTMYTMLYSIDGVQHKVTLNSESEYQAFLHQMMELARQGYRVEFADEDKLTTNVSSKEVVYFSTTSQEEAEIWAGKMLNDGYHVTITFDENTKTYNCTAWR